MEKDKEEDKEEHSVATNSYRNTWKQLHTGREQDERRTTRNRNIMDMKSVLCRKDFQRKASHPGIDLNFPSKQIEK